MRIRRTRAFIGAIAITGLLGAAGSAFTASNTVAASKAGQGVSATLTGYAVTNVVYTLGTGTSGDKITAVDFDLDAAAGTVNARITTTASPTPAYSSCTAGTSNHWSCDFSAASYLAGDAGQKLDVAAVQ